MIYHRVPVDIKRKTLIPVVLSEGGLVEDVAVTTTAAGGQGRGIRALALMKPLWAQRHGIHLWPLRRLLS